VSRTCQDVAPEDESDDPALHVLVDPGQPDGLYAETGFLFDFADETGLDGLFELEDAARWLPATVVGAPDCEKASIVADDRCGDADGVFRRLLGTGHGSG
jgi:hypothetical protein